MITPKLILAECRNWFENVHEDYRLFFSLFIT